MLPHCNGRPIGFTILEWIHPPQLDLIWNKPHVANWKMPLSLSRVIHMVVIHPRCKRSVNHEIHSPEHHPTNSRVPNSRICCIVRANIIALLVVAFFGGRIPSDTSYLVVCYVQIAAPSSFPRSFYLGRTCNYRRNDSQFGVPSDAPRYRCPLFRGSTCRFKCLAKFLRGVAR